MTQAAMAPNVDPRTRAANRRLAIAVGLVAVGFYVLMILVNSR